MCRRCHEQLTEGHAITDLQKVVAEPHFDNWNTTSVAHLFQFALGSHGPQSRVLSLEALCSFSNWYEQNRYDGYMPSMGLEPMYRLGELKETIAWLESYSPPEDTCMDERLDEFATHMPSVGTGRPPSSCILF
jgi:hypothetical protein